MKHRNQVKVNLEDIFIHKSLLPRFSLELLLLFLTFLLLLVMAFAVDIISAIEFDRTGDHLATGDRGGRVVLFERTDTRDVSKYRHIFKAFFPLPVLVI